MTIIFAIDVPFIDTFFIPERNWAFLLACVAGSGQAPLSRAHRLQFGRQFSHLSNAIVQDYNVLNDNLVERKM